MDSHLCFFLDVFVSHGCRMKMGAHVQTSRARRTALMYERGSESPIGTALTMSRDRNLKYCCRPWVQLAGGKLSSARVHAANIWRLFSPEDTSLSLRTYAYQSLDLMYQVIDYAESSLSLN